MLPAVLLVKAKNEDHIKMKKNDHNYYVNLITEDREESLELIKWLDENAVGQVTIDWHMGPQENQTSN